MDDYQHMDKLN